MQAHGRYLRDNEKLFCAKKDKLIQRATEECRFREIVSPLQMEDGVLYVYIIANKKIVYNIHIVLHID